MTVLGQLRAEPHDAEPQIILGGYTDADSAKVRRNRLLLLIGMTVFCFAHGFFFALTAPYLIMPMTIPVALMGALVIWALPDLRVAPTRTMGWLFTAFFVASIVWPNYLAIALPGLPWITLIRLFGVPMAILLLVSVSTSKAFRQEMAAILRSSKLVWMLLCGFVFLQFATIPLSSNPSLTISKVVISQINWTAIFFVSCYIFAKAGRAERWAIMLCLMAFGICALSAWEFAEKRVLWAGHIPSFLKIDDAERYLSASMRRATRIYRVKAVFTHPLGLAEFLALALPFMIHFVMSPYKIVVRLAAAVTVLFMIVTIIRTDSRLGVVGIFIAFAVYMLLWSLLRFRREKTSIIATTILYAYPAMFTLAVASTFFVRKIQLAVWGGGAHRASNASRDHQMSEGLHHLMTNPLGHGMGRAGGVIGNVSGGILTIDNYYLAIALDQGVLGFVCYFGMILAAIYYASTSAVFREARHDPDRALLVPIAVSLVSYFVIKSVFSQSDNHSLVFMMLGLVVALNYRSKLQAPALPKRA